MDSNFTPLGIVRADPTETEKAILGHTASNIIEIIKELLNTKEDYKLFPYLKLALCFAGLLIFWASETIMVALHKHFTIHKTNLIHIILSFLCLLGFSIKCFIILNDNSVPISMGSSDSFFVTGVLYFFFAFHILFKGIKYYRKNYSFEYTYLLLREKHPRFFKKGWSLRKVATEFCRAPLHYLYCSHFFFI